MALVLVLLSSFVTMSLIVIIIIIESSWSLLCSLSVSPIITGHLVLVSGKEGKLLQKVATPNGEETFCAPQVLLDRDGVSIVVFGTGGQASPGGLYAVPLHHLVKGNMLQEVREIMLSFNNLLLPLQ
jgi:hypothetical protein